MKKILPSIKILYSKYFILFIFNNITSHLIYIKNALYILKINKKFDEKQFILYNS